MTRTVTVEIRNRWTGETQFACEVGISPSYDRMRAIAVQAAIKVGADLSGADLSDIDLSGVDLTNAGLTDDDLRPFKTDLWKILDQNRREVPALLTALKSGWVDGSTYRGSCACLVGTIANARGVPYSTIEHDAARPAERWFAVIRAGDKPGDKTGGGYANAKAVEWTETWLAMAGGA